MNFRSKHPEEIDLNITPLIDVVFLLLIFFMVSTTFSHQSELNITLPEASRETTQLRQDAVNITVDEQSQIYVNDQKLPDSRISTIKEMIYSASAEFDDAAVVISADRETPYQMVVRVMDAARQLGLVKITFATKIDEEDY